MTMGVLAVNSTYSNVQPKGATKPASTKTASIYQSNQSGEAAPELDLKKINSENYKSATSYRNATPEQKALISAVKDRIGDNYYISFDGDKMYISPSIDNDDSSSLQLSILSNKLGVKSDKISSKDCQVGDPYWQIPMSELGKQVNTGSWICFYLDSNEKEMEELRGLVPKAMDQSIQQKKTREDNARWQAKIEAERAEMERQRNEELLAAQPNAVKGEHIVPEYKQDDVAQYLKTLKKQLGKRIEDYDVSIRYLPSKDDENKIEPYLVIQPKKGVTDKTLGDVKSDFMLATGVISHSNWTSNYNADADLLSSYQIGERLDGSGSEPGIKISMGAVGSSTCWSYSSPEGEYKAMLDAYGKFCHPNE